MIFCAAIKQNKIIVVGKRHCDCIATLFKITGKQVGSDWQGFVDENMKFYNREDAAKHALECGQVKKLKFSGGELFSEDLY